MVMSDSDSSDSSVSNEVPPGGFNIRHLNVGGMFQNIEMERIMDSDSADDDSGDGESIFSGSGDGDQPLGGGDFTCEEDREIFRGISRRAYRDKIVPFLYSLDNTSLDYDFHHQLSDSAKERIGSEIASTTGLNSLRVAFTEEEPQSFELLFQGPFEEQSEYELQRLTIRGHDDGHLELTKLTQRDWGCISQYLQTTRLLRYVELSRLRLDTRSAETLASALGVVKLGRLILAEIDISDEDLALICKSLDASRLYALDVSSCSVGKLTCKSLANNILREKEESDGLERVDRSLKTLNLQNNPLDDQCVNELCRGLENNIHLRHLSLTDCDDISLDGWKMFNKLVYNTTSLRKLYESNHTLNCVDSVDDTIEPDLVRINNLETMYLYVEQNKGHHKIVHFVTADFKFNIEPFIEYKVEIMPFIIGFFASKLQSSCRNIMYDNIQLWCIYEIIRRWNPADLFGFPSAEKIRLSIAGDKVESKVSDLEMENARLLRENELLRMENNRLKSANQQAEDDTGNVSKRARRGQ